MLSVSVILSTLVVQLPVLIALVTGLALTAGGRRRLTGRAAVLAKAGFAVLLVEFALGLLWSVVFPYVISELRGGAGYATTIGLVSGIVGFMLSLVTAAGIGLLIAALLAARPAEPPAYAPPPGYGAPPPGHGPPLPGYGAPPPYGSVPPADR